jgi:hypothetical protein
MTTQVVRGVLVAGMPSQDRLPVAFALLGLAPLAACASSTPADGDPNHPGTAEHAAEAGAPLGVTPGGTGSLGSDGGVGGEGGGGGPCQNLACKQVACPGGGTTTVKGTVYDPAGRNPLYNVTVFVPNSTPEPLPEGVSCNSCSSLYTGDPIAVATTDADGTFALTNVPDGTDIPLVVQVGKWRKQTTIPAVTECGVTTIPDKTLTLPKNHTDPGNDMPNIAISTGGADTLECLLVRVGIDEAEYTGGPGGSGRIHIFQGAGQLVPPTTAPNTSPAGPSSVSALWDQPSDLTPYDLLLLSCEGQETAAMNQQAMMDYASAGGRIFASHYHYSWFDTGPFGAYRLANWTGLGASENDEIGNIQGDIVTKLPNGQPFTKGLALQQWLSVTGALTPFGQLPIDEARDDAFVTAANTPSQQWITASPLSSAPGAAEYFSFNTPVAAAPASQCGRVVFSDIHVGAASSDDPTKPIPAECSTAALAPQEKALEFMLFDLSSCISPDSAPPTQPIAPPK